MRKTFMLACAVATFAAVNETPEAEAKNCGRLCRPVVRRICKEKYSNLRIRQLCRKEGNREIIPYCLEEPDPKRCY
jgi:hypothetical protein